ncbi:hypothetical protein [Neisseria zalophi]|uniref:Uncharacterized protein n=1 Tax=Neisseria zalophi TaxID=640030 RepID=A0A5J6PVH4_9NEIS|nr:hypothetical protein [Neisseria zalophi]QEY26671.1 hypothetical protein D0T92_09115 [Neisseria zalophi]
MNIKDFTLIDNIIYWSYMPYVFFNWYCAFYLCKKYKIINSITDFFIFKKKEVNKFLWGIISNKSTINIEKDFRFYVVKYGLHYFILHMFVFGLIAKIIWE